MSDSPPEPSPTRAVLAVSAGPEGAAATSFSWPNGVALALALAVDAVFAIAIARGFDLLLAVLVPYAAGLTIAVALLRPRPEHARGFPFVMAALWVQLLVFLDFWCRLAGLYGRHVFSSGGLGPLVFALACWLLGGVFALIVAPYTRYHMPLVIVETLPMFVFVLALGLRA